MTNRQGRKEGARKGYSGIRKLEETEAILSFPKQPNYVTGSEQNPARAIP